ncbi:MAG: class I SAM-dependent methyltransferase [Chitinispirillaceae bacterium]|nr:class I SAM-dependent methyltransferase [Chitinispirillaceae bacterium]
MPDIKLDNEAIRECPVCGNAGYVVRCTVGKFHIVKCTKCHFVYNGNPPDERELYEQYYEEIPPEAYIYNLNAPLRSVRELFIINSNRARKILTLKNSGTILDIGCGQGYFLKSMAEKGFVAQGAEISKAASEYGRNYLGVDINQGTMDDIGRDGKKYDVITMWHVLEHFISPIDILEKARNLLSADGVLVVEVPNLNSLKFILSKNKWQGGNHPLYHRSYFEEKTLLYCLRKSGFNHAAPLNLSYKVPGMSSVLYGIKKILNKISMDSFLSYEAGVKAIGK